MLREVNVTTLVPVKDLDESKLFYEKTLQLSRVDAARGWLQFRSGMSDLITYETANAGSNRATTAAWTVNDVRETVRELKANGVTSFQHYDDLPGTRRIGDIYEAGPVTMAWFKDPSGNIFEINGRG
jgi:catechol 2,3-dioxygenase-like lactoylglutathione lyase family enzyme